MDELEAAEHALREATSRAQELAAMGSLELHAAITGGPDQAPALLAYHQQLRQLAQLRAAAWAQVRDLRAARSLPAPEIFVHITPDFGPVPKPDPGTNRITDSKQAAWVGLLGAINAGDVDLIARYLRDLDGWIYSLERGSE